MRNKLKYLFSYYLPSSLFVIVSWVSFLIPPPFVSGRMTLLITLFLVLGRLMHSVQGYGNKREKKPAT